MHLLQARSCRPLLRPLPVRIGAAQLNNQAQPTRLAKGQRRRQPVEALISPAIHQLTNININNIGQGNRFEISDEKINKLYVSRSEKEAEATHVAQPAGIDRCQVASI